MLAISRRRILGATLLGAGAALSGCGLQASGNRVTHKGRVLLDQIPHVPPGLIEAANFPLI